MLGPVFSLELLLGSRRGKLHAFRRVYAGWLIGQFVLLFALHLYEVSRLLVRLRQASACAGLPRTT